MDGLEALGTVFTVSAGLGITLPDWLQDANCKREALGVELYGFQQQLANLQLSLERSYDEFSATSRERQQKEEELSRLKSMLEDDSTKTKAQRAKVSAFFFGLKSCQQETWSLAGLPVCRWYR